MLAPPPRLLLIDPREPGVCDLHEALERTQAGLLECAAAFVGGQIDGYDLLTVNYDALGDEDRAALLAHFSGDRDETRLLLVSGTAASRDYVTLFGRHTLMNLLACNSGQVDADDLAVTVRKLLQRDIFGLDKYIECGPSALRLSLRCSDDKLAAVSQIEAYATAARLHERLVEHACTVADEFITNAFYNAPTDAQGQSRYSHLARTERVTLEPGQEIQVTVTHDGRRLGICTTDPFGSLTDVRLLDYLAKCFRGGEGQVDRKAGGAGLGLFFAFKNLSHFVVNIGRGKRTEMIGLIDAHTSYRTFARRSKSFNVFTV